MAETEKAGAVVVEVETVVEAVETVVEVVETVLEAVEEGRLIVLSHVGLSDSSTAPCSTADHRCVLASSAVSTTVQFHAGWNSQ